MRAAAPGLGGLGGGLGSRRSTLVFATSLVFAVLVLLHRRSMPGSALAPGAVLHVHAHAHAQLPHELPAGMSVAPESSGPTGRQRKRRDVPWTLPGTSERAYGALAEGRRYFLYSPSGGFNNQLICLFAAASVARSAGRGLIVPMCGRHSSLFHNYYALGRDELVPMDLVLDFPHMERLLGIELVPLNVPMAEFNRTILARRPRRSQAQAQAQAKAKAQAQVLVIPVPRLLSAAPEVAEQLRRRAAASQARVAWMFGRFFNYQWLRYEDWAALRFAPTLQELAHRVAEEMLDARPFNAMHIRMGDVAQKVVKRNQNRSHYLTTALALGFARDVPVYVASEASREAPIFSEILHYFDKVFFAADVRLLPHVQPLVQRVLQRLPSSHIRKDVFGNVEQLLCARADRFVGTSISTFTKTITVMRRNLQGAVAEGPEDPVLASPSALGRGRVTASISYGGVSTVFAQSNATSRWHNEKWFMASYQMDKTDNAAHYVTVINGETFGD